MRHIPRFKAYWLCGGRLLVRPMPSWEFHVYRRMVYTDVDPFGPMPRLFAVWLGPLLVGLRQHNWVLP